MPCKQNGLSGTCYIIVLIAFFLTHMLSIKLTLKNYNIGPNGVGISLKLLVTFMGEGWRWLSQTLQSLHS